MRDMPRIYPDFLRFDTNTRRGRGRNWEGMEWGVHLVVDYRGIVTEGSVVAWRSDNVDLGPVGVTDLEFGPFDDFRQIIFDALVSSALKGDQRRLF